MKKREELISLWFNMWTAKRLSNLECIFDNDVYYIESWGPRYHDLDEVKTWFEQWNKTGDVIEWKIKQFFHKENQTIVEWSFKCKMEEDSDISSFDGMSLIKWSEDNKIWFLKEFKCDLDILNF